MLLSCLRGIALERREAIQLFREICDTIPDMSLANCVLLKPKNCPDALQKLYELQIRIVLNESVLEQVRAIVSQHKLLMETAENFIVIYRPAERSCLEITA